MNRKQIWWNLWVGADTVQSTIRIHNRSKWIIRLIKDAYTYMYDRCITVYEYMVIMSIAKAISALDTRNCKGL